MSPSKKDKKLVLGSALAGLILAGPGLSVTATPTAKFFQTAQLNVGYRQAQAADATAPAAAPAADKKDAKTTPSGHCAPDGKCGTQNHCGKDSKDKHCCAKDDTKCDPMKHCAAVKPDAAAPAKTDAAAPAKVEKKDDKEKSCGKHKTCGEGACGK